MVLKPEGKGQERLKTALCGGCSISNGGEIYPPFFFLGEQLRQAEVQQCCSRRGRAPKNSPTGAVNVSRRPKTSHTFLSGVVRGHRSSGGTVPVGST